MSPRPSSSVAKLVSVSRLFGPISEATRRAIAAQGTRQSLRRGDYVYRLGERAFRFTSIVSGVVRLVRRAPDGTEIISALFGPRESMGTPAVLERSTYTADAVVTTKTAEILAVEAGPLLALAQRSADVASAFTRILLDHNRAIDQKMNIMTAGAVAQRLAVLFLSSAERFGDELEDGSQTIPVPLSRHHLAAFVGARVETTIRIIRTWERRGILETNARGFRILDVDAMTSQTRAGLDSD